ncbi:MAG: hypothetical protein H6553_04250 [Chitinophagales bacterium]|nr:hypothetical protein [Chitinophagales bacterium]
MGDLILSNGKLTAVFIVILIIFIGLIAFLFSIDRKVNQLEEHQKNNI